MTPLIVIALAVIALCAGAAVLMTFGPRYRVGRLLSTTALVSIGEARALAETNVPRYVRVDGRVDSETDFPDEHQRPLVFRRRRLQARRRARWESLDEQLERVPFQVRQSLESIEIDGGALDAGLVVLPRMSEGTAAEVPDRVPAGTPPTTPLRYRVDQISAVEHAIVLGVPTRQPDGTIAMTRGLGRPLVLTTLEVPEAMRILAGGRKRPVLAAGLLGTGIALMTVGVAWSLVQAVA